MHPTAATSTEAPTRPGATTSREPLLLALVFLALYAATVFPTPPPVGDAADYTAMLAAGHFPDRMAGHTGYYALLRPVVAFAMLLGQPAVLVTHGAAAFSMAVAVALSFILYRHLGLATVTARNAAIVLGVSGLFWYNALFGEVNALCIAMMLAAAVLYVQKQYVAAGTVFGLAVLVSQLAVPWAVVFPLLALHDRNWRGFAYATLAGIVILALGILPVADDFLYGPRGVFSLAAGLPLISLPKLVFHFGFRLLESFTVLVPFMLVGAIVALRHHRLMLGLAAALCVSAGIVGLRSAHVEYGVTWTPALMLIVPLAAVGIDRALAPLRGRARSTLAYSVIGVAGLLSWLLFIQPKRHDAARFAADSARLAAIVGDERVVAESERGMAYIGVTRPDTHDVWSANWVLPPSGAVGWDSLLSRHRVVYAMAIAPEPHVLRKWMFNNPLAARLLDQHTRANYTSDLDSKVPDGLSELGGRVRLELILDTGYMRAWRVQSVEPGEPDSR